MACREGTTQPLLGIQRQLVHGMPLNWLHSGTSGLILSDETEICGSLSVESIARAEIPF